MFCPRFPLQYWRYLWRDEDPTMIRLSIFLITGVCAGFPALLWALIVLYRHHKNGGRISFIVTFLLLSDLLELILNPFTVTYILNRDFIFPCIVLSILFGARLCGHLLHQLAALENILSKKYPSLAVIFSAPCSIILCIFVLVVTVGIQFFDIGIFLEIHLCLSVLPVTVFTCVVTCKATPDTSQATDRKPGMLVLSVALFTLLIIYVPFYLTCYLYLPLTLDVLVSMRLVSEPLLCVLICRENHLVQTKLSFEA